MAFLEILTSIGLYIWESFKLWLYMIFVAPGQNADMFWILAPIYVGWIFADFFQEKRGTSLGNAISNGVIALWAGIDWIRTTIKFLNADPSLSWTQVIGKFFLAFFVLCYGLVIIYEGIKGSSLTKYIGRIREVTYFLIIFTPIVYGVKDFNLSLLFGTVVFFPLFYYFVELIDKFIPDPKSITEDQGASRRPSQFTTSGKSASPNASSSPFGADDFKL